MSVRLAIVCLLVTLPLWPLHYGLAAVEQTHGQRTTYNLIGYRPWRSGWAVYNIIIVGDSQQVQALPEGYPRIELSSQNLALDIYDRDQLIKWQDEQVRADIERIFAVLQQAFVSSFGERQRELALELHLIGPRRNVRYEYTEYVSAGDTVRLRFVLASEPQAAADTLLRRALDLLAHEIYHVSQWGRYVGDPVSSETAAHLWGLCALDRYARHDPVQEQSLLLPVDAETLGALASAYHRLRSGRAQGLGGVSNSSLLGRSLALLMVRASSGTESLRLGASPSPLAPLCQRLESGVPPLLLELPEVLSALRDADMD